jgi:hypothetical protein
VYEPPLSNTGKPRKRQGFMVPCQTDSDCFSRCGSHPDTGLQYRCTLNPLFYTFHAINRTLTEESLALAIEAQSTSLPAITSYESQAYKLSVLEARPKWITNADTVRTQAYYVDEPGDEIFDVPAGSGVCTDFTLNYAHTNCDSRVGSAIIVGLVGCTAKLGINLGATLAQDPSNPLTTTA